MSRDDQVYLEHIRDAIDRIEEYTKDIDESDSSGTTLYRMASLGNLGLLERL
jgi:uncharacterized protein with HEPN domain